MLKNNISKFLISAFLLFAKAFGEMEIEEIEVDHENMPEIMPELPQVQDSENAVEQGGAAVSQVVNEQYLIVAIVVLACIVVALLIVIIYSKFQKPSPSADISNPSNENSLFKNDKHVKVSSDMESAVKSFLTRTNLIH